MKRFTKAVAVTLTASMLLSFASCSKKDEKEKEEEEETKTTTTVEETTEETTAAPTATPTPRPTATPTPTPSPSPTPVPFDVITFADGMDLFPTFSEEDIYGGGEFLEVCFERIITDDPDEYRYGFILSDASAAAYPELKASLDTLVLPEHVLGCAIRRADSSVFSYVYSYDGETEAYNYNSSTGELITLDALFSDMDGLCAALNVSAADLEDENNSFVIEPSGVTFVFGSDSGEVEYKTVLYKGNESLFAISDIFGMSAYAMEFRDLYEYDFEYTVDLGNDGVPDVIAGRSEINQNTNCVIVSVNGQECSSDEDDYLFGFGEISPTLICADGSYYLAIDVPTDNDYHTTCFFDITSGTPTYIGSASGDLTGAPVSTANPYMSQYSPLETEITHCLTVDPYHMFLRKRTNLFSTYDTYYPMPVNTLPANREGYGICNFHLVLTALTDVPATDLDTGADTVVPEGTVLRIALADKPSGVFVLQDIETGTCYVLRVDDPEEAATSIGGADQYELFAGVYYSG